MSAPTRTEALSLYRNLLRSARLFSNYNFRNYVVRRSTDAFRHFKSETDASILAAAFQKGLAELGVAKRQVERLVVEPVTAKASKGFGYSVYRNK
ncbi:iron-sulfur cluster biosynthesis protein Isd11 [Rhizoclosmatium globosum]|uniref:Iron-sulfur cluster biosynthesis protein Isd11 n=1 Tax=Rhizoclosmatium globosum TaxID=329046 RepID=A0A1Y2BSV6_9FUNG|nr:iron-sulfur cluster biosynthesis protein Isd11 [Rhizoclosmatium globosum]|eukprot:ORY37826.1 iron-sulfur cluster biosynthesis protein Isd11 [Rhizoclosmatium globosum]